MSSRITVTDEGIVYKGKTFDFETCADTGGALSQEVRCDSIPWGGVADDPRLCGRRWGAQPVRAHS